MKVTQGPSLELPAVLSRLAGMVDDLTMNGLYAAAARMAEVVALARIEAANLGRTAGEGRPH